MTISYKLLIVSSAFFLVGGMAPVIAFRNAFHTVVFPVQIGIHKMSSNVVDEVVFLRKVRGVKAELFSLYKLKDRVGSLESEIRELRLENTVLKNQLGYSKAGGRKEVLAYVTGASPSSLSTTLTLNVGFSSGVGLGDAVIYERYLIGVVSTLSSNACAVKLLNDSETKVSALSVGGRARGVVVGNFGTNVIMKDILIGEPIEGGEEIITSGEDARVPKGLVIGKVARVNFKEQAILKTADIELAINPRKLERVFVVTGERGLNSK